MVELRWRQCFQWGLIFGGVLAVFLCGSCSLQAADMRKQMPLRPSLLTADDVAVIYNVNDARSLEVARYYMQARNVPEENLIGVTLPRKSKDVLSLEAFEALKRQLEAKLKAQQVLLLVWRTPFAVQCNSITAALTLGFDATQCRNTCAPGKENPYFNSPSLRPKADHQMRLSMLLPLTDLAAAKALIDRGLLSEFALNEAGGYFLKTQDAARSKPRELFFPQSNIAVKSKKLTLYTLTQETLENRKDIMFYFTGRVQVEKLASNQFLPGAVADHLTSTGGVLRDDQSQMPITRWLEAGATGSYGTVSEPCNYWEKFSHPQVLVSHYLAGETLIEAYWKSVKWPAQGLFVGEPLAKPYAKNVPFREGMLDD